MLTQDDYKLYTGESTSFSDEDWTKLVSMSAARLAGQLCLEELPTDAEGNLPEDLKLILANFVCLMLADRGRNLQVSSKRVRNFTINYSNNGITNAFAKLEQEYGDILGKYSNCTTIAFERNYPRCGGCCERF